MLVVILGVLLFVLVVLGFNQRIAAMRELGAEAERLATEQAHLQHTQAALQTQIAVATSDALVEKWAYEEERMVRDGTGDRLIIPLPMTTVTPEATQEVVDIQRARVPNWQVWLALFFDPEIP